MVCTPRKPRCETGLFDSELHNVVCAFDSKSIWAKTFYLTTHFKRGITNLMRQRSQMNELFEPPPAFG